MADLISKIGADSSQFRTDVGQLPGVVKKNFDAMKQASEGGLEDSVKGLKRGFNDLKDILAAGGIVAAVTSFFNTAIDAARKSTDANDLNAAAVRRFGDALDGAKEHATGFSVFVVGTFNRIGEQIGSGLKGIGAAITGTFAAWGEGERVLEATDKAARAAELSLAQAKKHAEDFKKLNEEAKNLAEQREAAERKLLPLAEQKNILQQKLLEAQRAEAEAVDSALDRRKAQVEQSRILNGLLEVQKGIDAEADKAAEKRRAEAENLHKLQLNALDLREKIAILTQEIADSEALINSNSLSAAGREEQRAVLAERRKNLQESQNKLLDEEKKYNEDLVKLGEGWAAFHTEILGAQTQRNNLLRQEKEIRLEVAKTEEGTPERMKAETRLLENQKALRSANKDVAGEDKEIALLMLKGRENLNEVEKLRLDILTGQVKQADLDQELHLLTAKSLTSELLPAEKDRLEVLIGQTKEIKKQAEEADKLKPKSMGVGFRSDFTSSSTEELKGIIERNQSKASDLTNPALNYQRGGPVVYLDRLEAARLNAEAFNAQKELDKRTEVAAYARRFGEAATVRQYGDSLAERVLSDVRDTGSRSATALDQIQKALQQSPLFR